MDEDAGGEVSGEVEVASCFSSVLAIFCCLVFITWRSRAAPDSFSARRHYALAFPRSLD
jgi:hypothetical protein